MIIKNATILDENFKLKKLDIKFDEIISELNENLNCNDQSINAENLYLIPGLIDIHTHGGVGFDSCDMDTTGYEKMSQYYAKNGITSFLFTTMTFSENMLKSILLKISNFVCKKSEYSYSHGIYLEGPFINPKKKGAQAEEYIVPPNIDMFKRLFKYSNNLIKIAAVAPETDNGLNFVKEVSKLCNVTLAHTNSNYDIAVEAFNYGAKDVTHIFNATSPFLHRDPGIVGASLDKDSYIEIICDGYHLHPSTIRTLFKAANNNKTILISDSMRGTGLKDGKYSLGGQNVYIKNNKAMLSDGTLAGSASNLMQCVKKCVSFGISFETAIKSATINPARLIGVDKLTGSIKINKYADLVLIDKSFNIKKVFIKGREIK